MKLTSAITLMIVAGMLSACDRYRVTLNDRPISEPLPLFTNFQVADAALQNCLQQAIIDQGIRRKQDLQTLICSHAGITSLEGIEFFSSLHTLNLANNNLSNVSPLLFLGNLDAVNLEGNPSLDCDSSDKLAAHLPENGTLILPEHCAAQK
ncbi:MAG: leucine-rich repeat domain-containing protein [Porticoccaceae bacterium]|jgi:Leucine-rich repeat (LRR) protein